MMILHSSDFLFFARENSTSKPADMEEKIQKRERKKKGG